MNSVTDTRGPADLTDIADRVVDLVRGSLIREAEVVIAFLTLWILERVESGRMSGEQADDVFTTLDMRLTDGSRQYPLCDEAQELIFEGEHFHHFGETEGPTPGPRPDYLRTLAFKILKTPER